MSISTPQGGGSRRPAATKAAAGGKPNLAKDEAAPASKATGRKAAPAGRKLAGAAKTVEAKPAESKPAESKLAGSKAAGSKAAGSKAAASKGAARPAAKAVGARPAAKGGGRRPIAPVRVSQGRNWGPIALFGVVILIAVGIIGFAGWKVYESALTVSDKVGAVDGAKNFRKSDPNLVKAAQHQSGPIKYGQNPPVAGKHNADWQNCMGEVYDAPIANEHAVHSMEHGAVWVVYNPAKLSKDQIDTLGKKVAGKEYSLMSPMENLDTAVSVQAWGFQLKTDNPTDKRIDEFIKATRKNAGVEAASCSGGITETGTTPRDLQPAQQTGG
jgi:hypothetical protein